MTNTKMVKVGTGYTTSLSDKTPQVVKVDMRPIRLTQNREYLKNANVKAFLGAIAWAEGGGYDFKFGAVQGRKNDKWRFKDFSTHPGAGAGGYTTAAGMYQITQETWKDHGIKGMDLSDFSPETQDLIAVSILRRLGAVDALLKSNFKFAIEKAAGPWAALEQAPGKGNKYPPQPYKKNEDIRAKYLELGGKDDGGSQ